MRGVAFTITFAFTLWSAVAQAANTGGRFPYQPHPSMRSGNLPSQSRGGWLSFFKRDRSPNLKAARAKIFARELKASLTAVRWGDVHGSAFALRRAQRLARTEAQHAQLANANQKVRSGMLFHARRLAYQPQYDVKGIDWPVEEAHFALNVAQALGGAPGTEDAQRKLSASAMRAAKARATRGDVAGTYSALEISGADPDQTRPLRLTSIAKGLNNWKAAARDVRERDAETMAQIREQAAVLLEAHQIEGLPLAPELAQRLSTFGS